GLDESYLGIRSNILTREPLPLVKATFVVVSSEESHKNATTIRATKPTATAFVIGYTVDRCFELVGYVKKNFNANTRPVSSNNASASADVHSNNVSRNNATTSNSHVSLSNEQLSRLTSLLNDNGVSTTNANMAVNAKFLINLVDISNLGLTVSHPNGTQALITKIGDLKINNDITLYDVLVVPEYTIVFNKTALLLALFLRPCGIKDSVDQVLNALKTTLDIDSHSTSDHLCDTCNKAKQTREPFPLSKHKSTKIGELVHS
ncbi:hypothetical protein Tco_0920492, partial [Tanacetum coccineum]